MLSPGLPFLFVAMMGWQEEDLPFSILNEGFVGPTPIHVIQMYLEVFATSDDVSRHSWPLTGATAICHFLLPKWKNSFWWITMDNLFIALSPMNWYHKKSPAGGKRFFWRSWGRSSSEELVWLMSRSARSDQALGWTFLSIDALTFVHNPMVDHNSLLKLH
jgi:hypothetical protein